MTLSNRLQSKLFLGKQQRLNPQSSAEQPPVRKCTLPESEYEQPLSSGKRTAGMAPLMPLTLAEPVKRERAGGDRMK